MQSARVSSLGTMLLGLVVNFGSASHCDGEGELAGREPGVASWMTAYRGLADVHAAFAWRDDGCRV
jgi:hypothetical protein